jgi:hypothetical protein
VFGPNPISALLTDIVAFLPRIAVAIIIVVIASAVAAAVKDLVMSVTGRLSYGNVLANIASVFIIALGVIAALSQIGVAVAVTLPVLITVLATIGGILVVGVGGGLIRPMQQRWERWLDRAEQEAPMVRAHSQAYERGREDAARPAGAGPREEAARPAGAGGREETARPAGAARADTTDPVGTRMDAPATDPATDVRKP